MLPSDLNDEDNWAGGPYELAIELEAGDGDTLERTLLAVWREACVSGCFGPEYRVGKDRQRRLIGHSPVELGLGELERYEHLHGLVRLPSGADVVCGATVIRQLDGSDWLCFYIPLGALAGSGLSVRAYPFGPDEGRKSLEWRQPIDDWLACVAIAVSAEIPFRLGLIGCDASGSVNAAQLATSPGPPYLGYILPVARGIRYQAATA